MPLTLKLLGYPTVTYNQRPVTEFISQKSLVLLCYLALEPRQHARETLAGLFWGEMPQARAMSNLRQALHNLQKLFPDVVDITRQTVQFSAACPLSLDTALLNNEKPSLAAISAYEDDFLTGIVVRDAPELEHWIETRRAYYHDCCGQHLHALLAQHLAQGDWERVMWLAQRTIQHDPYYEMAYQALWRANLVRGSIADALTSYQALCDLLRTELNTTPTALTRTLGQRLTLAQAAPRHNLPTDSSVFVGREPELSLLSQRLHDPACRLLTLLGMGGVGKSRLARELGRQPTGRFVNGVCYVALASVTDELYLDSTLADALNLSLQQVANPKAAIAAFLAERELLIILDNVEHLPAISDWISHWLTTTPDSCFLVTSRQPLGLREEWIVPLEGLPFTTADSTSMALLTQVARQNGQALNPQDQEALALCVLLEGLPLGIEIAAALLPHHPLAAVVADIRRNPADLHAPWKNVEPRHRSLYATFMTSWQWLTAPEQQALARLTVFSGTFSAVAASVAAGASPELLEQLCAKSLVQRQTDRYSLHALIHRCAEAFHTEASATDERYAAFFLAYMAEVEALLARRDVAAAIQHMRTELHHLRAVWQAAVQRRDLTTLARMLPTFHRFYEGIGWFVEGQAFLHSSRADLHLDAQVEAERYLLGRLQAHEAGLLLRLGRVGDALATAERSVLLLSAAEDAPEALAFALNTLGIAQLYTGDTHAASQTLEQCAAIYRDLDKIERIKPLINLSSLYTRTGDTQRAYDALQEAHTLAEAFGDRVAAYHIVNGLGTICALQTSYAQALVYFEEALTLSDEIGYLQGKAITLNNIGDTCALLNKPERGAVMAAQAVAVARQIEDARALTYALTTLTINQVMLADASARDTLAETLQTALNTQAEPMILMALYAAGRWTMAQGQTNEAAHLWALVAQHPATEMDYRRRAQQQLGDTPVATVNDDPAQMARDLGLQLTA